MNNISKVTSASDSGEYPRFCQQAADNAVIFENFRSNKVYQTILEHFDCAFGTQCLDAIRLRNPNLLSKLEQFRTSDLYGGPLLCDYGALGKFSPSTLRYVRCLGHLVELFGALDGKHIIEIGGGYGGLCKVLNDAYNVSSYTIVDIPPALKLTKRFIEKTMPEKLEKIKLISLETLSCERNYDLLISNCAFTECIPEIQDIYIAKVLDRAKHGYITYNLRVESHHPAVLLTKIEKACGRLSVTDEYPVTCPTNFIVVWGELLAKKSLKALPYKWQRSVYGISPPLFWTLRSLRLFARKIILGASFR